MERVVREAAAMEESSHGHDLNHKIKTEVLEVSNVLLELAVGHRLKGNLSKYQTSVSKAKQFSSLLPRIEGEVTRINFELKLAIIQSYDGLKDPQTAAAILCRHNHEYS